MSPPGLKNDEMDAVFAALASEPRRRILDILKKEPGANVGRVCEFFDIGRIAVMKHLATLERGGLLVTAKDGRDKRLWFDPTPLQLIHERWTTEFSAYWAARLTRLKYSAEGAEVHALPPRAAAPRTRNRRHG